MPRHASQIKQIIQCDALELPRGLLHVVNFLDLFECDPLFRVRLEASKNEPHCQHGKYLVSLLFPLSSIIKVLSFDVLEALLGKEVLF